MLNFQELNHTWAAAVRRHAVTEMTGDDGKPFRAIGDKTLTFLDELWAATKQPLPDLGELIESGRDVRLFGDCHMDHDNIIKLCSRPHADVNAMNDELWLNILLAAEDGAFLVCLGDWAMKEPLQWQRRFHREVEGLTVVGNHDVKGAVGRAWAPVGGYSSLAFNLPLDLVRGWIEEDHPDMADLIGWSDLPGHIQIGLAHWPLPPDRLPGPGWISVHGHIHHRQSGPLRVNVSVEAIDYRPQSLRQLLTPQHLADLELRQRGLDALPNDGAALNSRGYGL